MKCWYRVSFVHPVAGPCPADTVTVRLPELSRIRDFRVLGKTLREAKLLPSGVRVKDARRWPASVVEYPAQPLELLVWPTRTPGGWFSLRFTRVRFQHPSAANVKALREHSRMWWYHRELRNGGNASEARKCERESLRSDIRSLRNAHLAGVAHAGTWLDHGYSDGPGHYCRASTSGLPSDYLTNVVNVWAPNVPTVDKRTVGRIATLVMRSPMADAREHAIEGDGGSLSRVSIGVYCAVWEALGAKVHWGRLAPKADVWRSHAGVKRIVERMSK